MGGILASVLIGAIAGYIGGKIKDKSRALSIILGAVGGFLGSWLFGLLGIAPKATFWGQLLVGSLGGIIVLLLVLPIMKNRKSGIIRWYIDSNPQGADITWRVISTTANVHNTNLNYIGTTPYETTEALNIKGLSKSNSNKVQIEICCEKTGYVPQKKRFNLGQVYDQCEITTKFNLIRE